MSLKTTIKKAAEVAGSQTALAELIGATPQHISSFKSGARICGLKTRIKIAEIAGVDRVRTIFEYFVDSLDEKDAYEHAAKESLQAMLNAFPPETDEAPENKKPLRVKPSEASWRKRRDSNP
ncbi:MAG: hypothetical protein Q8O29_08545 [Polaromonas sp.]|uniref:helix-turn-helix transcriptional regulator n=1 Tax=Polaromonas sp. TaxID=1869339 RepID=UPI002734930D|nr:hypothetical protein [Polaromonas sp.]MDP2818314.1 hypothetical protein [Polaromonas sp.]